MKYMLLTYSPRDFDFQNFSTDRPEWVGEMIAFMHQLNEDLQASGELVAAEGLADPAETGPSGSSATRRSRPTARTPRRRRSSPGSGSLRFRTSSGPPRLPRASSVS